MIRRSAAASRSNRHGDDDHDDMLLDVERASKRSRSSSNSPSHKKKTLKASTLSKRPVLAFGLIASALCLHYFMFAPSNVARLPSTSTAPPVEFLQHPRLLQYDSQSNTVDFPQKTKLKVTEPAYSESDLRKIHWEPSSSDDKQEMDEDGCVPMHDWMTDLYTNCHRLHEINMHPQPDSFVFINCGGDRCAFRLRDIDDNEIVLKTMKFRKDFTPQNLEKARHDAVATERLTASPYIANIFGACGASQLVEYSSGGNLHDLIKIARLAKWDAMGRTDILRIGVQISAAVADMHTFEKDNVTSLTHQDLCCHQFLLVDGVYKLNDFHLSKFLRVNKDTGRSCPQHKIGYNQDLLKIRAPEEQPKQNTHVDWAKIDVFTMGNVLYYVLTKEWLLPGYGTREASKLLAEGHRTKIPKDILNSEDPADQAMIEAIHRCWIQEAEERPSAREISDQLKKALFEITGQKEDVVRVVVPPLPKDHRYTDSDFYASL